MKRTHSTVSRILRKFTTRQRTRVYSGFSNDWQLITQVAAGVQGDSWYQITHPRPGRKP